MKDNQLYDPEAMTFQQQENTLKDIYQNMYPWHGTIEANSYEYPTFMQALNKWAGDDFYKQHTLAKAYCDTINWIFQDPIIILIDKD